MVYSFSDRSVQMLNTVRLPLNILAHKVLRASPIDFAVTEGYRDRERQKQLYEEGKSKTLNSKHCIGEAIDIVPYINGKADFSAINECCIIIGLFLGIAKNDNLDIRTGALWDGNSIKDNSFPDMWHIELV